MNIVSVPHCFPIHIDSKVVPKDTAAVTKEWKCHLSLGTSWKKGSGFGNGKSLPEVCVLQEECFWFAGRRAGRPRADPCLFILLYTREQNLYRNQRTLACFVLLPHANQNALSSMNAPSLFEIRSCRNATLSAADRGRCYSVRRLHFLTWADFGLYSIKCCPSSAFLFVSLFVTFTVSPHSGLVVSDFLTDKRPFLPVTRDLCHSPLTHFIVPGHKSHYCCHGYCAQLIFFPCSLDGYSYSGLNCGV